MITRTREEAIRRWVTALRSKKYKQTREQLRHGGGFCCLGVVCDLLARDGGPQWTGFNEFWGEDVQLPKVVAEFLSPGFSERVNMRGRNFFDQLAWYNDHGASFAELATKIEKELLP